MRLRLAALPLVRLHRLMPRLPRLRALHPELHIDIDTGAHALCRGSTRGSTRRSCWRARSIRRSIRAGSAPTGSSPSARAHLAEGPRAIGHPAQLAQATVLLHRDLPDAFDYWREAMGVPDLEPAAIDHFDSGQLILDAAAQGLGVAFMFEMPPRRRARPAAGPAVRRRASKAPTAYWFACRRAALGRRPVRIFHDWLFEHLAGESSG